MSWEADNRTRQPYSSCQESWERTRWWSVLPGAPPVSARTLRLHDVCRGRLSPWYLLRGKPSQIHGRPQGTFRATFSFAGRAPTALTGPAWRVGTHDHTPHQRTTHRYRGSVWRTRRERRLSRVFQAFSRALFTRAGNLC